MFLTREECYVGLPVWFGRGKGEQTIGKIVKLNGAKAKVQILQARGSHSQPGAVWGVPYSMLRKATQAEVDRVEKNPSTPVVPASIPQQTKKLTYSRFSQDNNIIAAIVDCYFQLEPEVLTCDGELSHGQIAARSSRLQQKLKYLQLALGYAVSESDAFDWNRERDAQLKEKAGTVTGLPNKAELNALIPGRPEDQQ